MAPIGLLAFLLGGVMFLAPNTIGDRIMGAIMVIGGLVAVARAYQNAQR